MREFLIDVLGMPDHPIFKWATILAVCLFIAIFSANILGRPYGRGYIITSWFLIGDRVVSRSGEPDKGLEDTIVAWTMMAFFFVPYMVFMRNYFPKNLTTAYPNFNAAWEYMPFAILLLIYYIFRAIARRGDADTITHGISENKNALCQYIVFGVGRLIVFSKIYMKGYVVLFFAYLALHWLFKV